MADNGPADDLLVNDVRMTYKGRRIAQAHWVNRNGRMIGCFRNLMLVTCPQLVLAKALVLDLELTKIGDAKLGCSLLLTKSLHQLDQQFMTEVP